MIQRSIGWEGIVHNPDIPGKSHNRCTCRIGGPYEAFGGRDASRALARFAVDAATDKYDDLSDLNTTEMNSIKEWEEQFKGKRISAMSNG